MRYDPVKKIMTNDSSALGKTPGSIETALAWIDYDLDKLKKDARKLVANKQEIERLLGMKYVDGDEEQKAKALIDQINKEIISFRKRFDEISSMFDHKWRR